MCSVHEWRRTPYSCMAPPDLCIYTTCGHGDISRICLVANIEARSHIQSSCQLKHNMTSSEPQNTIIYPRDSHSMLPLHVSSLINRLFGQLTFSKPKPSRRVVKV